jgi:hypothetical protein
MLVKLLSSLIFSLLQDEMVLSSAVLFFQESFGNKPREYKVPFYFGP